MFLHGKRQCVATDAECRGKTWRVPSNNRHLGCRLTNIDNERRRSISNWNQRSCHRKRFFFKSSYWDTCFIEDRKNIIDQTSCESDPYNGLVTHFYTSHTNDVKSGFGRRQRHKLIKMLLDRNTPFRFARPRHPGFKKV